MKYIILILLFNSVYADNNLVLKIIDKVNKVHPKVSKLTIENYKKKVICYNKKVPKHFIEMKQLKDLFVGDKLRPQRCNYEVSIYYNLETRYNCLSILDNKKIRKVIKECFDI